ncbi:hypothetical protein G6O67_003550 [Ophiocordyceps sinensis]|uniref:Uncharacterized protein n=1 Tax=Ophiocordyceps sinensis TaxID=72228 RepID=A0A8H4V648_9HYPO|nr:hypothetical protein G6O67_003550 [Ophiocordyceps sinensis]
MPAKTETAARMKLTETRASGIKRMTLDTSKLLAESRVRYLSSKALAALCSLNMGAVWWQQPGSRRIRSTCAKRTTGLRMQSHESGRLSGDIQQPILDTARKPPRPSFTHQSLRSKPLISALFGRREQIGSTLCLGYQSVPLGLVLAGVSFF